MHNITPFHRWEALYDVSQDERSPFYGKEYNYDLYSDTIYGYFIDPGWDFMGSETLYLKILFADYQQGFVIIELIGEWNDAINNDIMHFKRNVIDLLNQEGISRFILIGENILNFHGSDDCYYEEWFEEIEEGWICAINFRDFVLDEWKKFNIDSYINFGGGLEISNWRTLQPRLFYERVNKEISRRIDLV